MALAVAIQMDPIDTINIDADSTFALALEAQARGHALFHYLPDALIGRRVAFAQIVRLIIQFRLVRPEIAHRGLVEESLSGLGVI